MLNERGNQTHDFSGLKWARVPDEAFGRKIELLQTSWPLDYSVDEGKQIFVRSNFRPFTDGGCLCAFAETHEAQPDGSVLVAGRCPMKIALTRAAVDALTAGRIVEISQGAFDVYQARQYERFLSDIDSRKESYRQRYIALLGSDEGFEGDGWPRIRQRLIENPEPKIESVPAIRGRGFQPIFGL